MNQTVNNLKVLGKIFYENQAFIDQTNVQQINNISDFERNFITNKTTLLNDDLIVNKNIEVTNQVKANKVRLHSILYEEDVDEVGNIREQKKAFTQDMKDKIDNIGDVIPTIVDPVNKKIKMVNYYTGKDPILYPNPDSTFNQNLIELGKYKILDGSDNMIFQIHQPSSATYFQNLYYSGSSGGSLNFVLKNSSNQNYFPIQCISGGGVLFNDNVNVASGLTTNLKNTTISGSLSLTGDLTHTTSGVITQSGTGTNTFKGSTFTTLTTSGTSSLAGVTCTTLTSSSTTSLGATTASSLTTSGNFTQSSTGIISQSGSNTNTFKKTIISTDTGTGSTGISTPMCEIFDSAPGPFSGRGIQIIPSNSTAGWNVIVVAGDSCITNRSNNAGALTLAAWGTTPSGVRIQSGTSTASTNIVAGTSSLTVSEAAITISKPITISYDMSSLAQALNFIGGLYHNVITNANPGSSSSVRNLASQVITYPGTYLVNWTFEAKSNSVGTAATMVDFKIGISKSATNTFDSYSAISVSNLNLLPMYPSLPYLASGTYVQHHTSATFISITGGYIYFNYIANFTGASQVTLGGYYSLTRIA